MACSAAKPGSDAGYSCRASYAAIASLVVKIVSHAEFVAAFLCCSEPWQTVLCLNLTFADVQFGGEEIAFMSSSARILLYAAQLSTAWAILRFCSPQLSGGAAACVCCKATNQPLGMLNSFLVQGRPLLA